VTTQLLLLGGFDLQINGQSLKGIPRKAKALLAYLALQQERAPSRETVAELLWPGRGAEQARHSLRQTLFVLRSKVFADPDAIIDQQGALSLAPGVLNCDAWLLREDAHAASMPDYAGPLLDGFPPVSAGFDDWLAMTRSQTEAQALAALGRHADAAADAGQHDEAIATTQRMLAVDPLREDIHRRLMSACAAAGRRSEALRHFATVREILLRELGVAPAPETVVLAEAIKDGRAATDTVPPVTAPARPSDGSAPRIAVLPFHQFGATAMPSYLSDGLVADVISQLAGLRELSVISHGSTLDFRDSHDDIAATGYKLGARYLMRGALRQAASDIRLTTELVEVDSGCVIGTQTSEIADDFDFADQDRIVAHIVNTLAPRVHERELFRIRGTRPSSLTVYEKVLLAREHMMSLRRHGFDEAKTLLDAAIAEEPDYAEAHALAADWHGLVIGQGWSGDRQRDMAAIERQARKALSLDGGNVRALVSYGHRRSLLHRDYETAKSMFQRALNSAPNSTHALRWSSLTYAYIGEAEEALTRAEHALELSPCDRDAHSFYMALCVAHYTAGDYPAAADWGLRAMAQRPVLLSTGGWVAAALVGSDRAAEARDVADETMADWPHRRVRDIVAQHPYSDPERRRQYGEHLLAAGFPE